MSNDMATIFFVIYTIYIIMLVVFLYVAIYFHNA